MKLGLQKDVNVTIVLEDGTEIDDDELLLACENATVFIFVPDGEQWSPPVTASVQAHVNVASGNNIIQQNVQVAKGRSMK